MKLIFSLISFILAIFLIWVFIGDLYQLDRLRAEFVFHSEKSGFFSKSFFLYWFWSFLIVLLSVLLIVSLCIYNFFDSHKKWFRIGITSLLIIIILLIINSGSIS